jgi:hypothetical protein
MTIREPQWSRRIHLAVIGWLITELAIGVFLRDATHLENKGMVLRAVFYPVCAIVVPIGWRLRGSREPFPHLAGALLVTPFALDIGANLIGLFEVDNFDDVLHALNWFLLVLGASTLVLRSRTPLLTVVALGIGTGATTIVLWEIVEYLVSRSGTTGLQLTYDDTITDLAESFAGGCVGAVVAGQRRWSGLIRSGDV